MYKDILKEIGAEESYMEYLFEESDDEDNNISSNDDKGDGNDLLTDLSRRETSMNERNGQTASTKNVSVDGGNLLNQWESETEESGVDDPNKISREEKLKTSTMSKIRF